MFFLINSDLTYVLSAEVSKNLHLEDIECAVFEIEHLKPLSILRSRKKLYFAIDEVNEVLVYFKDEADLVNKKEPFGEVSLRNAVFNTVDGNPKAFLVHLKDRTVQLEAENQESCECWMDALYRRFTDMENRKLSRVSGSPFSRRRDRSMSMPSSKSKDCNGYCSRGTGRKHSIGHDTVSSHISSLVGHKLSHLRHSHGNVPDVSEEDSDAHLEVNYDVPLWLDEWVSSWLHQNNTMELNRSTPTSPYQSLENSGSESEGCSAPMDELLQLRAITNHQKLRIHELTQEKKIIEDQNNLMRNRLESTSSSGRDSMAAQNRFLNGEILRLNKKNIELEDSLVKAENEICRITEELEQMYRDYVFALQSTIHIPLHDNNACDVMKVHLIGGDVHVKRICQLAAECRKFEPSLPTFQSLRNGCYVDVYGFRQHFETDGLAVHYMAMLLHEFYRSRSDISISNKKEWKQYLEEHEEIETTPKICQMVRRGIPNSLRATVWKLLIHQHTQNLKLQYGKYYYRNLCNLPDGNNEHSNITAHEKQINLDLLRTMPNNVHFMSANCKGISQLQQVLRAFCMHNSNLGYCQGMNFLASTALLFVGPEDVFWFLIAITEKYFDASYYDGSLAGAQADQEVLKEMLENRYPAISQHLQSLEIDLATITLNWFLALFFDAVPFNTLLRIWDCFMLEGPEVLFRFALVLLGHHQDEIKARSDTIGIIKVVKAAVKLCYDPDELIRKAFDELQFPTKSALRQKQRAYLEIIRENLSRKEQIRNILTSTSDSNNGDDLQITDIFPAEHAKNTFFVAGGNRNAGQLGKIVVSSDRKSTMTVYSIDFDCRIASLIDVTDEMLFISLISGYIMAVNIENDTGTILWELKLPDVALRLRYIDGKLFAALASGTLTILENAVEKSPTCLEFYHIPIGPAPLTEAILIEDQLCIATACKLVFLDMHTLTVITTVYVACSSIGGGTPFFEKISCICSTNHGLFLATARSTLVQLWAEGVCALLFDISFDHKQRKPSLSEDEELAYIVTLAFYENTLWVGTSDGYVIIYSVENEHEEGKFFLKRYPSGRRLSPKSSPGSTSDSRTQLCYIPTKAEAFDEEQLSKNEFRRERRSSRVSINIDQSTKEYHVRVNENNNIEKKSSENRRILRRWSTNGKMNATLRQPRKNLRKDISADSAVSVFSSDHTDIIIQQAPNEEKSGAKQEPRTSVGSSEPSMEYDELFDIYSDEDQSHKQLPVYGRRRIMSLGTQNSFLPASRQLSSRPILRRKDLQFSDPMLVAVQENNTTCEESNFRTDLGESDQTQAVSSTVRLSLLMKLKVSDTAVRKIMPNRYDHNPCVLTCAGLFNGEESVLVWRKEQESGLWMNDPVPTSAPTCTKNRNNSCK